MEHLPKETLDEVAGLLDLGMAGKAADILDALPWELQTHPEVLAARVEVCLCDRQWGEAASIAGSLADFMAEEPQFWIWWAYATHRAGFPKNAVKILGEASGHHPEMAFLHYDLARRAAARGRRGEARKRLARATGLDPDMSLLAATDPVLQCLGGPRWLDS